MKSIQYTIRNIPEPVNRYLRKRSQLSGKSLNQVIIDELSEKVASPTASVGTALSWFIGSGVDSSTLEALAEEDKIQKALSTEEQQS
jgi:plasmid stability protein